MLLRLFNDTDSTAKVMKGSAYHECYVANNGGKEATVSFKTTLQHSLERLKKTMIFLASRVGNGIEIQTGSLVIQV
jgi:hypothetical protein